MNDAQILIFVPGAAGFLHHEQTSKYLRQSFRDLLRRVSAQPRRAHGRDAMRIGPQMLIDHIRLLSVKTIGELYRL